jgi:hypothetical protein
MPRLSYISLKVRDKIPSGSSLPWKTQRANACSMQLNDEAYQSFESPLCSAFKFTSAFVIMAV